jgi:ATP phosphoribosyltransferase regulatory subunit HisZ
VLTPTEFVDKIVKLFTKRNYAKKEKPHLELADFFCAKPFDSRIIAENKSKPLNSRV